ncbi:hypothetical protein GGR51DRAFT_578487 [Nemania sp. FL0031]|nr:hypothetical protein GGR51DRAFT_578487 [Nemania sp. FL0031]
MMPSIIQGISKFRYSRSLAFSSATVVLLLASLSIIAYRQQLSHADKQLKKKKLEQAHKPKTWRLFIDPSGNKSCSLMDVALQAALETQLGIDIDGSRLGLVVLKPGHYCATLSLKPMKDPFTSRQQFTLYINGDGDRTHSVKVTPDDDFLHMTTLYDGTAGKSNAVDLIVVPGLSSHPYGSFKSPMNASENWLRDYLHEDLPDTRILVYGYDSDLRNRQGKESIEQFSDNLLGAIYSYREGDQTTKRPIIFIGHSLGGLLIKQALVRAKMHSSPIDETFLNTCYGFLFFGVPNLGLRHESLLTLLGHSPTTRLVDDLVVDSDSEVKPYLRTLGELFTNLFQGEGLDIVAFYETRKTPTVADQGGLLVRAGEERLLVTQDSATMIDGNVRTRKNIPIPANHSTMVKYNTCQDQLYKMVLPKLKEMAKKAPNVVEERLSRKHRLSEEQTNTLNRLRLDALIEETNSGVSKRFNGIAPRCNGTLEWFLKEEVFEEWRDATTASPLWICGPPGQGKSVLAKFLTGHLEEYVSCHTNERAAVVSFFCNAQRIEHNKPIKILYGLLLQIISSKEDYESIGESSLANFPKSSFDQLWGWFSSIVNKFQNRRVYCIIDALDECSPTEVQGNKYHKKTERQILMERLVNLSSQKENQFRLLVTSRPGEDDITACQGLGRYDLEVSHHDIERFVNSYLTNLNRIDDQLKFDFVRELNAQAGGTFLWVSMVLRELNGLNPINRDKVDETLRSIPKELDKMYRELIERLENQSPEYGKILAWVAYAKRPLTIIELSNALKFDPHNKPEGYTRLSDMEKYEPILDSDWITTQLGSFLSIRQVEIGLDQQSWEYIYFRHQSIKDFFDNNKHSDDVVKFLTGDLEPDLYLACTCVAYLNAEEWENQSRLLEYAIKDVQPYANWRPLSSYALLEGFSRYWERETNSSTQLFFLHYATASWYKHVRTREQAEHKDIKASITQLLHKDSPFINKLRWHVATSGHGTSWDMFPGTSSWHISLDHIAIKLEIPWLIEQILDDKVTDQSFPLAPLACNTPTLFQSLFAKRKEQFTKMLSQDSLIEAINSPNALSGLNCILKIVVDKESIIREDVLESAASKEKLEVNEQLLNSGAYISITDDCLRIAAYNRNQDVARLLLKRRHISGHVSVGLASELVRIAASHYFDGGPLQVLLDMYGDRIYITEEHLISTKRFSNFIKLLKHMSLSALTEAKILCILKYYQEFQRAPVHENHIIQQLLSSSQVQISINEYMAELAARYVPRTSEMDCILQLRASGLPISEGMVAAAAGNAKCGKDILELFYKRDKMSVKFTEKPMLAVMSNDVQGENILDWMVDSSLLPDPNAITFPVITCTIYSPHPGANILRRLSEKGFTFDVTEDIIKATAKAWLRSYQEFIQHSVCIASWELHRMTGGLLDILLCHLDIDVPHKDLLHSILGTYADVFPGFSSDKPRYGSGQWTDLHYAACFEDHDFIREEVIKGANVDCRNWMQATPLHVAASQGKTDAVKVLLGNHADINARDKYNRTPLHYAAYAGFEKVVLMLLARGASIDHTDILHQTPLHYAVQYGRNNTARVLLDSSADANLLDAYGRTADESIQEPWRLEAINPSKTMELREPRKATAKERNGRLHNVIHVLTSQLLRHRSRDTFPGFYELGHCLALLGIEDDSLAAYKQAFKRQLRPILDHTWGPGQKWSWSSQFGDEFSSHSGLACSSLLCNQRRSHRDCALHVCMTCFNQALCNRCWEENAWRKESRYADCSSHKFMLVPKPTEIDEGAVPGITGSVVDWLKKIRDEFGVDPQVHTQL